MASPFFWKLKALIRKNLILMRRNLITTLFEIFFPVLMFGLIIALRKVFSIDRETFDSFEKNIYKFMAEKSVLTGIDFMDIVDNVMKYNLSYIRKLGFDYNEIDQRLLFIPPLYICSELNDQHQKRGLIASIGIPQEIKDKMINDSIDVVKTIKQYKSKYPYYFGPEFDFNFVLSQESFKEFETIEDMEKYIKDPDYINRDGDELICFGLSFSHNETINHYNYSLHFFDFHKMGKEGVEDIPSNAQGMFDRFQSGPDLIDYMKYKNGAYNYMMKIVNEYILRQETEDESASLNYGIIPMKYTDFRFDKLGQFFGYLLTIILIIAYMVPLSLYVYRIVGEKESKTKEGMKIMGLGESEYFLSYFLQYLVISIFVSLLNTFLFKYVFTKIPFYFLYFLIFLFSLNIFGLVYFFQSFIDKTRIAIVLSLVIYFMMYCFSLACMFEKTAFIVKIILAIFPLVNLNLGILLLSKFEYHFRYFYNRDFFIKHYNYSLFDTYLMFVVDFLVLLFLGFYLHNVLPHDFGIKKPFYFLCSSSYWCKKKAKKYITIDEKLEFEEYKSRESLALEEEKRRYALKKVKTNTIYGRANSLFESEEIYNDKTLNEVFEIRNLVKIFGDGKKAVAGVNLNFYKDEIFALLGHNGAGKTTIISMLTGMYEATKGKALYNGINILQSDNMDVFREKLGICPQHDTLFEDLNIREHLEMFAIFKGVSSSNVKQEVDKVLRDFQMENIQTMLARNLSAGQRRKLSISISLIGGSQVIFLDEPSSGMDITSRRNLWEILKRQCDDKIIILTTHYMEEASVLGKRIGIIHAGRMKCIGSPLFLIEKYGKYMSLNVTKEDDADNDQIVDFITNLANNVEYEVLSEEIMFRIPVKKEEIIDGKKIKKNIDFSNFFNELDENIKNLNIKSYSVSMPTLEDVFLNVAAEDNKKQADEEKKKEIYDQALFSLDQKENYTQKEKFKNDFLICMKRRYLVTKRDIKGILMEVLGPILLVLFGLTISKLEMMFKSGAYTLEDLEMMTGKQKILFSSINGHSSFDYFTNSSVITYEDLNYSDIILKKNNEYLNIAESFIEKVYSISRYTEDSQDNEVDMTGDDYVGYYLSLLMFQEPNNSSNRYSFLMLLNSRVKHCIPIYTYTMPKLLIENEARKRNKTVRITYTHYPMPLTIDTKEIDDLANYVAIIFFVSIAFGIMPANFISMLVKERANNSKHLMRTSGINIYSYWIVNFIFEYVKYYSTGGVCLILLIFYGLYRKYLYIAYLTYGASMISLTYAMSFFFENESNVQNAIILLNFLFGGVGSIIILMLRVLESSRKAGKVIELFLALIPSFCFDFSFNLLLNKGTIYTSEFTKDQLYTLKGDEMIRNKNLMLPLIIYSSIEIAIYTFLFVLAESKSYSFKKSTQIVLQSSILDKEVQKETQRANSLSDGLLPFEMKEMDLEGEGENSDSFISIDPRPLTRYENVAVRVRNLRKEYRSGCLKKKGNIAINNLNFCIEPGECFGLLGLNGAGKTTTFKCITQEIAQDNGEIIINGKNINGNFNELNKLIGYCPQFDAIFEYLTVYENLEFYATIKGIKKNLIHQIVTYMIFEMSLNEFTNKIAGRLSGGNKRKLSVAVSMLGNPPIILLDEPSTGMDPEARRFMWSVIHKMSTKGRKSSVIMTTHSMDEAETLCRRMGIMVNGEFVCLGTANQIKDKYGYGYEADVRIKPMSKEMQSEILNKYGLDNDLKVTQNNLSEVLNTLQKPNYLNELTSSERLGERVRKAININKSINISVLLNWIFFVSNALKFIRTGKEYFSEIILSEHIENNFLFKLKKGIDTKSIGFFFGLFGKRKEECHVTEYSIQKSSLEQIFNKFASYQGQFNNFDVDDIMTHEKKGIIIDDNLLNQLISD